jgi:hypothetical protein
MGAVLNCMAVLRSQGFARGSRCTARILPCGCIEEEYIFLQDCDSGMPAGQPQRGDENGSELREDRGIRHAGIAIAPNPP